MYKLAVFDMDGTILNTLDDIAAAGNYALAKHGLPLHETESFKAFVGDGVFNLVRSMLPSESREEALVLRVLSDYSAYYDAHAYDRTRPYPGIPGLLQRLRGAGMRLAVLSNKPHCNVPALAEHYFPGMFGLAVGHRPDAEPKPDPARMREILAHFGVDKDECVYIGDSEVDIETGHRSGIATISVAWGFRTKNQLKTNGAITIIDKVERLAKILIDNPEGIRLY